MDAPARRSWFLDLPLLLAGCIAMQFMGGKWGIVAVTWIGSALLLRYFRNQRGAGGVILSVPFLLVASHLFFIGLAEQVTLGFRILIDAAYTLYFLVPCLVDRLLSPRISSRVLASLVYPAALVLVQFLLSFIEEIGTALTWAGALFSLKPLMQLVSVTGVWGVSFLVGWVASVLNAAWEDRRDLRRVLPVGLSLAGALVAVTAWGGARMAFFGPRPGTVTVGSVIVSQPRDNYFWDYLGLDDAGQAARREETRRAAASVTDELLAASARLVPAGVEILSWGSGNAVVFAEDEPALTSRLQDFAREHRVYFFPCLLVLGDFSGPDRTKVLGITPDGTIAYTHYKGRNPNAGYYHGMTIETLDTPFGRLATPICYEMESHRLIRQAGMQGADILIVPGDEPSREVAVTHTEYSLVRGIENGASILRTTLEGLTMAIDYQGRVLAQMDYYKTSGDRALITELPTRGTRTLAAAWGDWFAWLSIALLAGLAALAILESARSRRKGG